MKIFNGKNLLVGFLLCSGLAASAQNVQVSASMDSTSIMIGEQTRIRLQVTQDKNQTVQFPILTDTIIKGIEVLEVLPKDTIPVSEGRFTVNEDVIVTSFDSALYYIRPFRLIAGQDTLYSNPLALKVVTYDVDTESKEYFDIKSVKEAPFVFMDYIGYVIGALLLILAVILCIWWYRRWRYRIEHPESVEAVEPKLPPHVRAINALDSLQSKKLWQKGLEKEYYTDLTDILRNYLQERFHVNTMEMTSSEIINVFKRNEVMKSSLPDLKQVLELADFVKFAKLHPLPDENEQSLAQAKAIVNETMVKETPQPADDEEKSADA